MALPPLPAALPRAFEDSFAVDSETAEAMRSQGGDVDRDVMDRTRARYAEAGRLRREAHDLNQAMSAVARSGLPVAGPTHPITGRAWGYAGRSIGELREMRAARDARADQTLHGQDWAPAILTDEDLRKDYLTPAQGRGRGGSGKGSGRRDESEPRKSSEGEKKPRLKEADDGPAKESQRSSAGELQRPQDQQNKPTSSVPTNKRDDSAVKDSDKIASRGRPRLPTDDWNFRQFPPISGLLFNEFFGPEGKFGRTGYLATEKGTRIFLEECVDAAYDTVREEFGETAAATVKPIFREDRHHSYRGSTEAIRQFGDRKFQFDASVSVLNMHFYFQTVDTKAGGEPSTSEQAVIDAAVGRLSEAQVTPLRKLMADDTKNPTEEQIQACRREARELCREVFRKAIPQLRDAYVAWRDTPDRAR